MIFLSNRQWIRELTLFPHFRLQHKLPSKIVLIGVTEKIIMYKLKRKVHIIIDSEKTATSEIKMHFLVELWPEEREKNI